MVRFRLSGFVFGCVALAQPAYAHWGHVGEVAGHGHWIAIGAGIGAAALAAWLARGRKSKDDAQDSADLENEDAQGVEDGLEGETA
ncbi:MAG: DUF6732 family protein [Pseudomonadota bacterium]